ncbi:MAG: family 78 glycoside hydrolase catalytic domain [Planctomycetota bacterium]|nr:family 78 glycoside hydrolase catalytic domain [Planctomycetota bacterium]
MPRPQLSWVLNSSARDQRQRAYQILSASDPADLARDVGTLWDSGKVLSSQTAQVEYAGLPLASRAACHWKVRVWDKDDQASGWSAAALWEMGQLTPQDWRAQWIGRRVEPFDPQKAAQTLLGGGRWIGGPGAGMRFFRAPLVVGPGGTVSAQCHFSANDNGELYLNGQLLLSGCGCRIALKHADLTGRLKAGRNVLGFRARCDEGSPAVICRVEVRSAAGAVTELVSDRSWKTCDTEAPGWASTDFDDARWPLPEELGAPGSGPLGGLFVAPPYHPAPFLRREFAVRAPLKRARAYVCGLGCYELRINGGKIGDAVRDPGYTAYDKRILYSTYDVTPSLRQGANAVGLILGTGWYKVHQMAVWGFDHARWHAEPRAIAQIVLEYEDGRTDTIVTGGDWKAATGPITFVSIYGGESYDARLERPGWDAPGFDDGDWEDAAVVDAPLGTLKAQRCPPIRITGSLPPVRITEPAAGVFVCDMGQNFSGHVRLSVSGPAGTEVRIRYGERLRPDGRVTSAEIDGLMIRALPSQRFQTDTYTLKGGGPELWESRFVYHGFQYVEVTGFPGRPTPENILGRFAHTAMPPAGEFACSNELLNKIQKATRWAYLSNAQSIPTDCPQREKNGWTGDAHLAAEQGMLNFDSITFYAKWLDDVADSQDAEGRIPVIIPTCGWGRGCNPAWDSAYYLTAWYLYRYFGDRRLLAEHYGRLQRYLDYLSAQARDHIMPPYSLGDWAPYETDTPTDLTTTAYYYLDHRILAQTARVLNKAEEADAYARRAEAIRKAFNARFFDPPTHSYGNGSQCSLACPLHFGLVEPQRRPGVVNALVQTVANRDYHLDVGVLGAKFVLRALSEGGRTDVAYRVATQTALPGWGHWIQQGATTLWEDWKGTSSLNHVMFGDISAWFYKWLAGIDSDDADGGFGRFMIRPQPVGDLTWVKAHHASIRGLIRSEWQRSEGTFSLTVEAPVNTSATVVVPTRQAGQVLIDGQNPACAEGVRTMPGRAGEAVFEVGSGRYMFTAPMRENHE